MGQTLAFRRHGITAKQAQLQLCRESNRLPIQIDNASWGELGEHWKVKRVQFFDDSFFTLKFPTRWRLNPSRDPWWSWLYDRRDVIRARVFFKSDPNDYRAYMRICTRYVVKVDSFKSEALSMQVLGGIVLDTLTDTELHHTEYLDPIGCDNVFDEIERAAHVWLMKRYPDYKDPFAYWDVEQ